MMAIHEQSIGSGSIRTPARGGGALLLAGCLVSCDKEVNPGICESPRATSPLIPADPNATNEGSVACTDKPSVTFSEPQPVQPLIDADITLPQW
ncbi:MAG TPA: hypothetical protein VFT16_03130 [Candidatus Saccharimonadales bacterium]|nr:hypothetical protein [Candidatus Saccharimonadales bacterium]